MVKSAKNALSHLALILLTNPKNQLPKEWLKSRNQVYATDAFFKKYTHLWSLSVLSCANVAYGGYIKDIQLVVLVDPVEEEALGIDAHCNRCSSARVLKSDEETAWEPKMKQAEMKTNPSRY